ncbi:hypothetical protein KKG31_05625 [Patescibacteria group bacterium]|nr:hypothetical protein [Patescibacteria group bacterium]
MIIYRKRSSKSDFVSFIVDDNGLSASQEFSCSYFGTGIVPKVFNLVKENKGYNKDE